jgi:hypothetical protein
VNPARGSDFSLQVLSSGTALVQLVPSSSISVTWSTWRAPNPRTLIRSASATPMVSFRDPIRSLTTSDAV